MLRDKPRFGDVAGEFIDFAAGARWIIHNAPFDLAFLDEELRRLDLPSTAAVCAEVIDTLALAREQFPGKKNNLDALCERFGIADAQRARARRAARRPPAGGGLPGDDARAGDADHRYRHPGRWSASADVGAAALPPLRVLEPSAAELAAHRAYLAEVDREAGGRCIWLALERAPRPLRHRPDRLA